MRSHTIQSRPTDPAVRDRKRPRQLELTMDTLPTLNASLNGLSAILLLSGFIAIKKRNQALHKKLMVTALISSATFLTCYLIYHFNVGSIPYPHQDWTRPVYYTILIPHVILAALMLPFIVRLVWFALKEQYDRHKRLAHFVWPVWMYVSVTGVIIYLMLYRT